MRKNECQRETFCVRLRLVYFQYLQTTLSRIKKLTYESFINKINKRSIISKSSI